LVVDYFAVAPTDWGFGFWLLLLAWIFEFFAGLIMLHDFTTVSGRVYLAQSIKVTFAALVFGVTAIATTHWVNVQTVPLFADHWTYAAPGTNMSTPAPYDYSANIAQYGLWQLCKDFSCVSISTDTTCSVDNGGLADFNNCAGFNAVRAFVLLTVILEFFFLYHLHWHMMSKETRRSSNTVRTGFVTSAFGVIATAITTSYYDLSVSDYSMSYWLFLLSWVIVFLVAFALAHGVDDKSFHKPGLWFATARLLTLISLIFFILAVALPTLTRVDTFHRVDTQTAAPGQAGWTGGDTDRHSDRLGMFYKCQKEGWAQKCRFIPYHCKVAQDHYTLLPEPLAVNALSDCREFNGIRTTAVLALLLTGFAFLAQGAYRRHGTDKSKMAAVILGYFAGVWGLVSFALALDYLQKEPTSEYASAFWLLVLAWVFVIIATFIFSRAQPGDCHGCGNAKCTCGENQQPAKAAVVVTAVPVVPVAVVPVAAVPATSI